MMPKRPSIKGILPSVLLIAYSVQTKQSLQQTRHHIHLLRAALQEYERHGDYQRTD